MGDPSPQLSALLSSTSGANQQARPTPARPPGATWRFLPGRSPCSGGISGGLDVGVLHAEPGVQKETRTARAWLDRLVQGHLAHRKHPPRRTLQ